MARVRRGGDMTDEHAMRLYYETLILEHDREIERIRRLVASDPDAITALRGSLNAALDKRLRLMRQRDAPAEGK